MEFKYDGPVTTGTSTTTKITWSNNNMDDLDKIDDKDFGKLLKVLIKEVRKSKNEVHNHYHYGGDTYPIPNKYPMQPPYKPVWAKGSSDYQVNDDLGPTSYNNKIKVDGKLDPEAINNVINGINKATEQVNRYFK